jgi:DNA-binding CsgD family transcriptional regulator
MPGARRSADVPAGWRLVGRDGELDAISAMLTQDRPAHAATVLQGDPGVGKTSLWEHGVVLGRERGMRVLVARASSAETGLPFAAVIDLLEAVPSEELAGLPTPQLHALEVALYRREPAARPPEPGAIALGLLTALRILAGRSRLLVALDDVQWLDRASEEALAYAARRLDTTGVGFLLARRPGDRSALEAAFPETRLQRIVVEPMSLGATRQILALRLGVRLPHHLLRRVYDTTLGNPLFVLEVGRMLAGRDLDALGEEVPVPDDVEDVLGLRVADLDGPARRVLLALALDADLKATQLVALAGAGAVASAVQEGVVVLDGERVRASHPLLAAAASREAPVEERQELHRGLAAVVPDEQRRALHLALATRREDEELAARVAGAAELAAARGATRLAVQLGTHAVRLTEPGAPAHDDRVLALGGQLVAAGEKQRLTDLLSGRVESLPTPAARVTGYLLLTSGVVRDNDDIRLLMERALAEAGDNRELRGPVLAELAENEAVVTVLGISRAERRAAEAVECCGPDRPGDRRLALSALTWCRALGGQPVGALSEEYHALSDEHFFLVRDPARVAGQQLVWRGELDQARELLSSLMVQAEEWAEPSSYALARLHLCELELRAGGAAEAERLLDEWAASTDSRLLHWPMYERCRALLYAVMGDVEEARRWAGQARDLADSTGVRWDWLEATRALGLAAMVGKDPGLAVEHLSAVWDHTEREGVADPGAFPVATDLVEALVEAGDREAARRLTARLADRARSQDHPWALLGARRCAAVVQLAADGYADQPVEALEQCAAAYRDRGLLFDEARTLLALGRAQRRARKWGAAREALGRAADGFEAIGSPGWAGAARSELARLGARRPSSPDRLTATERRVAELAADGLSNKEIARALVVTVNTVEFHLRNTYAKLGIRSRVQLAAGLLDQIS